MTCTFVPINLTDPSELEELRQQRLVCGWDNTPDTFEFWRKKQEAGLKSFFWITTNANTDSEQTPVRAGHISLDAYAEPADWDLANADKTNLTIQNFFILPRYRSKGLGRTAMRKIEALATEEPYGSANCEYITLTCLSKKQYYDEVLGQRAMADMPICNQEWYEKQGYVAWKEEPRYEDILPDQTRFVWDAAFMRKKVNRDKSRS
jgi:ribosomal protein S18 acetylase RimI-like enzyme